MPGDGADPAGPLSATAEVYRSPRLLAYLVLSGVGMVAAVALGRIEPLVLAAPYLVVLAAGLASTERPSVVVATRLDRSRALEGEVVLLRVRVRSDRRLPHLEIHFDHSKELPLADGGRGLALTLQPAVEQELAVPLRCRRWGGYLVGRVTLQARDQFRLFRFDVHGGDPEQLRVYPRPETLQRLLPAETQAFTGNEVSRQRGDGIEFADLRPFVHGEGARRVNWRVSARRGHLHVNEFHPERNLDVVIFLDTFSEVSGDGRNTLEAAVRVAAALARHYLERRDRVGVIGFGGTLRWLLPRAGILQLYRITESLLDTEMVFSYAWKGLEVIPRGTLPPRALVIALSPLLDDRSIGALLDLRRRGFDVGVIDVSPLEMVEPGAGRVGDLGHRLWRMRRQAMRFEFSSLGVPVSSWRPDEPVQTALEEMRAFKLRSRTLRV